MTCSSSSPFRTGGSFVTVIVRVNGDDVETPDESTLGQLLEQLGLGRRLIVVERNGEPVPRAEVGTTVLTAGDRLELVRAVAGG